MSVPNLSLVYTFGLGEGSDQPTDVDTLGGKGGSLAQMTRAGFPVPPGFTIAAACSAAVEQQKGTWPASLEIQVRSALIRLEQVTGRTFGRGPRPLFVAVRSGAAVSMPGMMDTILNCGLNPSVIDCFASPALFWSEYADHIRLFSASVANLALAAPDDVIGEDRVHRFLQSYERHTGRPFPTNPWDVLSQSINAVFASWNSERARTYRAHHDVRGVIGTAVNVQAMFPSERSGVLFTANPNQPAAGEMIIEASWGLGEAVVSGAVTPDIYILDAISNAVKQVIPGSRPGSEPALSDSQIQELAVLGRRIESHFGAPSDIEWGIADGRIALLQARKIRGLDVLQAAEQLRIDETRKLRTLANKRQAVWVVHNLSETLPAPTPLTWDLIRWFMSVQGGYGRLYELLGSPPREEVPGHGFLELIAGRIYVDPRRAARFHFPHLPFEYNLDEVLRDRTVLDRAPIAFNPDQADPLLFLRLPAAIVKMFVGARQLKSIGKAPVGRFESQALPRLDAFLTETHAIDLKSLTTPQILAELQRRRDFVLRAFAAESLLPGFFGGVAYEQLRGLLVQLLGPQEGERYAADLTTGLDGDITIEQNATLFEVAHNRQTRDHFLRRFGHRAANEMELSQPRWREDHATVDALINQSRGLVDSTPQQRHARQHEFRLNAERQLPDKLRDAGGSSLREKIETTLHRAQRLLPYRETGKFHLMRGYATLRELLVELGQRWDLGRDVFFLQFEELSLFEAEKTRLTEQIAARKLRWQAAQKLSLPDVIHSEDLDNFGRPRISTADSNQPQLQGRPIAPGVSSGIARLVRQPGEATHLGDDYVLVCPSTDPGWTPLFVRAKGLIVERGGILSHGAIVARDFGIPAIVLEDATQLIPDGSRVDLDANRGIVICTSSNEPSSPMVTVKD